ncbi:MAG: DUF2007 domain-containing protein [Planctomycetia bacterium]|nr:DUF2007 domain-containing protein [Planctomycetia bacterium]
MSTSERQVVVFTDVRPGQAFMVRNRLAEAGIEAVVINDALQAAAGDLPLGWSIAPRVVVAEADEPAAREIVRQYRAESAGAATHDEADAAGLDGREPRESEERAARELYAPPLCPRCDKPRMTVCPACQTASVNFPLADGPADADDPDTALLLCPTCDEAFRPVYLRRCEWCGHDFGAGIEPKPREVVQLLNDRVVVATVGMAIAILAIIAYFATLVR